MTCRLAKDAQRSDSHHDTHKPLIYVKSAILRMQMLGRVYMKNPLDLRDLDDFRTICMSAIATVFEHK